MANSIEEAIQEAIATFRGDRIFDILANPDNKIYYELKHKNATGPELLQKPVFTYGVG